jgi:glycosyltransferase involved in cell wall biosynthesis
MVISRQRQVVYFLVNDLLAVGGVASFVLGLASEFKSRLGCSVSLLAISKAKNNYLFSEQSFLSIFDYIAAYEDDMDLVLALLGDIDAIVISAQFDVHFFLQEHIKSKSIFLMFHGDTKELVKNGFYHREFSLLNYFLIKKYRFLILLSESSRLELAKNINFMLRSRLAVIPNGIDLTGGQDLFSLSGRYVYVGRLSDEKNVFELIELFSDARVRFKYKIDVYGDGPLLEAVRSLIEENGLHNVVFLRGHCDNKEEMFDKKQGLVLTSHTEGLPMVILEANKFGIPVFCYDTFATAADLVGKSTGCLISVGDREEFINKIVSDFVPDKIDMERRIKNYSFDAIIPKWINIFSTSSPRVAWSMKELSSFLLPGFWIKFLQLSVFYFVRKIKRFIFK